jgi:hypothetical protein
MTLVILLMATLGGADAAPPPEDGHFGHAGQAFVGGDAALSLRGVRRTVNGTSHDLGAANLALGVGFLPSDHLAVGAQLNADLQFGDQLGQLGLAAGPTLGAVVHLSPAVSVMPRVGVQYSFLGLEPLPAWAYRLAHGISMGGALPLVVELTPALGMTVGPAISSTFYTDLSVTTYGFYLGLLSWSLGPGGGACDSGAGAPPPALPGAAPALAPEVASQVAPPPLATGLQLCDGDDLLVVAPHQREPARVECRRLFSACAPNGADRRPACRAYTCQDAAEHLYEACKSPSKHNGAPVTKPYFVATCEQHRLNEAMSQCQVNCLATASCEPAAVDRCLNGDACAGASE